MKATSSALEDLMRHYAGVRSLPGSRKELRKWKKWKTKELVKESAIREALTRITLGIEEPPIRRDEVMPRDVKEPVGCLFSILAAPYAKRRYERWPKASEVTEAHDLRFFQEFQKSFAKKEFCAAICFLDMVGFSELAKGKAPKDVVQIVAPFISSVVSAAELNYCLVDKTIGDEVLVVMPVFPDEVDVLADIGWFLRDVATTVGEWAPALEFSCGIAIGSVVLEEIGAGSFREWTVYGNCVNGAKRLQSLSSEGSEHNSPLSKYRVLAGAIESECPTFRQRLKAWLDFCATQVPLTFLNPKIESRDLRGVGQVCYLDTYVQAQPDAAFWSQSRTKPDGDQIGTATD